MSVAVRSAAEELDRVRAIARRRLLVVTFHFPPSPAVGAIRWASLATLAVERGWSVDVVTLDPADLASVDAERLALVAPEVGVHRVRLRRPLIERTTQRTWAVIRATRARGAGAAAAEAELPPPDAVADAPPPTIAPGIVRLGTRVAAAAKRGLNAVIYTQHVRPWAREVVRCALALARTRHYDIVVTSGPPHMAHLAGASIARRLAIPHVADYRDPWSLVERLPNDFDSPLWWWMSRHYERRVLRGVRLVVTNTPAAADAMRAAYPTIADRVTTVMNGADDGVQPAPAFGSRFLIAFAGTIYLDRDPRLFLRAASRVVRELGLSTAEFGIRFIGNVERYGTSHLAAIAADENVAAFLETLPFLPRTEAMQRMAEAQMLLSLPQENHSAIPAKIFEYTAFSAWLLVLAQRGSATESLLRDSSAHVVDPADVDGMYAAIRDAYLAHRSGVAPTAVGADGRFSRRVQAGILFDALDRIVAEAPAPHA